MVFGIVMMAEVPTHKSSLNSKPQTPILKPPTPNPKPRSLNPKPQNLKPPIPDPQSSNLKP